MGFDRAKLSSLATNQIANSQLLNEVLRMIEIADLSSANLEHGIFGSTFNAILLNTLSYTEDSDGNCLTVTITGDTGPFFVFKRLINFQVLLDVSDGDNP